MAAELPRPGVEIIQEFKSASPTIIRPTLVPFVAGAAKEIVEVTTEDGLLNSAAKQGEYEQLPRVISQTSFPSPRGNIAEVDVEEATIKVFFQFGGSLLELERDPGESFLVAQNLAARPSVRSGTFSTGTGLALDGKLIILAIDVSARLNVTQDIAVTFSGTGNLTPAQIAAQINDAIGEDVASVITVGADSRIEIASLKWGAAASVTVRGGGSANTLFGWPASTEVRVEGSGFRAQDLNNNTTLSPWVEWSKGSYQIDGVHQSALPAYSDVPTVTTVAGYGFLDIDGAFDPSYTAPSTAFTGSGSLDLKVGDEFYADGVLPNSAVIMKVEASRFKLGTLNTKLSVFGDDGKVVSAVYDASTTNTLFSSVPFSPRYAWFMARGLSTSATNTAAVLTGTTKGSAATTATVEAPNVAPVYPAATAGLTLDVDVTIDGVAQDTYTYTFTGGPFAAIGDLVTAIGTNIPGVFAHTDLGGTKLALSTVKTGAEQELTLKASSTALAAVGFVAATAYSAIGKDVEFVDITAALLSGVHTFPFTPTPGETLDIEISADGGATYPTTHTYTFPAGAIADITALVAALMVGADWGGVFPAALAVADGTGDKVLISSVASGSLVGIKIGAGSTAIGVTTNNELQFVASTADLGEENLNGQRLKFKLNDRPHVYDVIFTSDSLVQAVASINEAVGWPLADIGGGTDEQLVITSTLKGYASKVEVVADITTTKAIAALGFGGGNGEATGTGRPNPDFWLDVSGNVMLGAEILRSKISGAPFAPGASDIYIQYRGLRKDVSPMAVKPGLLRINDVTTLQAVLSPIRSDNPLALGMFFMLVNAPSIECTGYGVDETSAAEPYGTPLAFARVASAIESEEIYAIAPMTHSETVAQIFKSHIEVMSSPEQKGERILFVNPLVPTRAVNDIVASGLSGNTTATANQFVTDVNAVAGLVDRGIDPNTITLGDQVFLELSVATPSGQEVRNYAVSSAAGTLLTLLTTFGGSENLDAFLTVTPLSETLVNADWSLSVRGDKLLIPGSTLPDKNLVAETVAAKASAYKQRRMHYLFPDKVRATLGGTEEIIEGFYACAAVAGMVAKFPPQQGFTNLPMTGFTGVIGSNDTYSVKQLNVMAGGGAYILMQEAQGAPLISRHQLSTNLTSIETRELSITKVVDFAAKFLRAGLRNFIGTFNITQPFLDTLSTVIQGMLGFLAENGIIIGGDLNNLIQSKDSPDTVLVDVTLNVPFPCNYVRLTLVI